MPTDHDRTTAGKPMDARMLVQLFGTFFLIGGFTFGGGYAMLELIRRQIVDKHHWMKDEEFIDLFAVAQSLPGVFAVNISIFVGYRLQGLAGAIVCGIGCTLPSFLIILMIAIYAGRFRGNPTVDAVFKGIRPTVVALIIAPCLSVWRALHLSPVHLWIPLFSAALVAFCGVSPVTIILVSALIGWFYSRLIRPKLRP